MQLSYPPHFKLMDGGNLVLVRAMYACICIVAASRVHAAPPDKLPNFPEVTREVETYFASQAGYESGDIIKQSQVEQVLKNVAAVGWELNNPQTVVELALPDSSFLIRELSTPGGKKFMRKVGANAGGYSHLERLGTIPRGEQTIRQLIRDPGGDQLITYMATTTGGHKMSKMMGGVRGGVDLNKPTKRIYTARDLLAVLKELHSRDARGTGAK
jgi:hypothetical protein